MKRQTKQVITALSADPAFLQSLEVAARLAARAQEHDETRGQAGGSADRTELDHLIAELESAQRRLGRLLLDRQHAECWPAADYAADLDALRRLHTTATVELAEVPPNRKRHKSALPKLAYLTVKAMRDHGLAPSSDLKNPAIRLLALLSAEAGMPALTDETRRKAIAAALRVNKSAAAGRT